jgi:putative ABC transport system permease protein
MIAVQDEIKEAIAKTHRLRPGEEADIRIFSQGDLMESAQATSGFLTSLLAGIAIVSLVVGGIGIMNIMLVTVTERTREIGIRKAIGARRRDILYQFLIESVTLSLVGGLIGIGLGLGISQWMAKPTDEGGMGYPMILSMWPVLMSFGSSAVVGIFFGIYPAVKASRLDPIEALRYE